jgi:hypothetical protein
VDLPRLEWDAAIEKEEEAADDLVDLLVLSSSKRQGLQPVLALHRLAALDQKFLDSCEPCREDCKTPTFFPIVASNRY